VTSAPSSLPHHPRTTPVWLAGLFVLILIVLSITFRAVREEETGGTGLAGSGVTATQVRHLDPFSAVDLAGANTLVIGVGAVQRVTIRGDDNLLDRITTTVTEGTLDIGNRGSFRTDAPMSVDITVPSLTGLTLSGSGTVTITGMEAHAFAIRLPGAGTIQASGSVDHLSATIDGAGTILLGDLIARDATVGISGTGTIEVYASGSLDARITGTGTIQCSGAPSTVARRITGTGSICA
jgi:preprotein translocase subunit SecG